MKKRVLLTLFIILNLFPHHCFGQRQGQALIDSLLLELPKAKEDTNKVNILNYLGLELIIKADFPKATENFNTAEQLAKKLDFKKGLADSKSAMGRIYEFQGNYTKSLEYQFNSLKLREAINDKLGISYSIHYIGDIYHSQGDLSNKFSSKIDYNNKALEQFFKSLKIAEEIDDKKSIANTLNCIGNCYREEEKNSEALDYYLTAIKLREETKDKQGFAITYNNIGKLYLNKNEYARAEEYLFKSLNFATEIGDKRAIVKALGNIGNAYLKQGKYSEAFDYCSKSLKLANEINFLEYMANANYLLSVIYQSKEFDNHNSEKALKFYKDYIVERDSINTKKVAQTEMNYEFDKKETAIKAEQDKKDALSKAESKKQKLIIVFVGLGLLLVLVFAGFVFRSLRIRNKQNKIIAEQKSVVEKQKQLVETKNKEILDSIEYALRIQTAILPPQKIVKQYLENSFILYKPKDIVAGDFYWMENPSLLERGRGEVILFAACDCTGHGVPGAMVSVVCHNALNRAVREFGLTQPAVILDKTAEIVIENFSKSEEEIKDGMDISLCSYNTQTKELQWAGANNPLWLLQNNQLIETKADKQPIGMHENMKQFTNHSFTLNTGDTIYLFTDGFADQFGGETGEKKLTRKRFKDIILSIQNKPMQEQGIALNKFITEYRNEVEQIDDILVMGVRV